MAANNRLAHQEVAASGHRLVHGIIEIDLKESVVRKACLRR